jgi:hypothetical protein
MDIVFTYTALVTTKIQSITAISRGRKCKDLIALDLTTCLYHRTRCERNPTEPIENT